MSKLSLKAVVKAVNKNSGAKITENECRDIARLFNIDIDVLNDTKLVRTVVLIAVTKKFSKDVKEGAIDLLASRVAKSIGKNKDDKIY